MLGRLVSTLTAIAAIAVSTIVPDQAAAAARGHASSFHLAHNGDGTVARWNPCATIHYRVNDRFAPRGGLADVRHGFKILARYTGMRFRYDGRTSKVPGPNSLTDLTASSTPRITVAWAYPAAGPGHSGLLPDNHRTAGVAHWVTASRRTALGYRYPRIVGASVVFSTRFNWMPGGFTRRSQATRGVLIFHELGHAVGLEHISNSSQIMNPMLIRYPSYGAGDIAGLRRVGRSAGCIR